MNRSDRYLDELGLNADIVKQWVKGGKRFDSDAGELVKQGLQKFVESTMLRPNAAERPAVGVRPALRHLCGSSSLSLTHTAKSFWGGAFRELKARQMEGRAAGKTGTADCHSRLASTFGLIRRGCLAFAMMSLELKELTKYSMGAILPFAEADASFQN